VSVIEVINTQFSMFQLHNNDKTNIIQQAAATCA